MTRAMIALSLVAAALAGLVLAELLLPIGSAADSVGTSASPQANAGMPSGPSGAAKLVAAILDRPLFRGDRRPAPGDARGVASGAPADLPRLTGILMTSEERRAIFQPSGKERPIVVVEGETVGNWRVQQIAVDAVTLTGPGGTRRIEPKFSGNGPPNTTSPPAPAVAGQPNGGPNRPQGIH